MDDTPIDQMLSDLESSDPAAAADVADDIAAELARRLDPPTGEARPAPPT